MKQLRKHGKSIERGLRMSEELKLTYKEQVYGYSLGAFLIDVARAIGRVHPMLPEYEYEVRLAEARSMLQALLAVIPRDVFNGSDIDPLTLMSEIDNAGPRKLREILFKITSALDRKKLLVDKKVVRRTKALDVES